MQLLFYERVGCCCDPRFILIKHTRVVSISRTENLSNEHKQHATYLISLRDLIDLNLTFMNNWTFSSLSLHP